MRYFDAVARHGHFGHAADACSVSQPALSMQIREMERILGTDLIERAPRRLTLTSFGEEVLGQVRLILTATGEIEDMARAARDRMAGRLRIGVIPTVAPYVLPKIVGALTEAHPGLDLSLRETITPRLLDDLADGVLDTAIVALPISDPAFHESPLFEEDFVLVRQTADAGNPVPSPERLREMRLLLLEEGHCFRDQALSFCTRTGTAPRETMDGSSLSTLVQMVGAGLGVTLIPEMAVDIETRTADVSIARFDAPGPRRTIGMIWRRSTANVDRLLAVSEVVRQVAHEMRRAPRDGQLEAT